MYVCVYMCADVCAAEGIYVQQALGLSLILQVPLSVAVLYWLFVEF